MRNLVAMLGALSLVFALGCGGRRPGPLDQDQGPQKLRQGMTWSPLALAWSSEHCGKIVTLAPDRTGPDTTTARLLAPPPDECARFVGRAAFRGPTAWRGTYSRSALNNTAAGVRGVWIAGMGLGAEMDRTRAARTHVDFEEQCHLPDLRLAEFEQCCADNDLDCGYGLLTEVFLGNQYELDEDTNDDYVSAGVEGVGAFLEREERSDEFRAERGGLAWSVTPLFTPAERRKVVALDVQAVARASEGAEWREISDGDEVRTGEQMLFRVRTSEPAYLYVVNVDGSGAQGLVYPGEGEFQRTRAGEWLPVPSEASDIVLDEATGDERFVFFATIEFDSELQSMARIAEEGAGAAEARPADRIVSREVPCPPGFNCRAVQRRRRQEPRAGDDPFAGLADADVDGPDDSAGIGVARRVLTFRHVAP